MLTLPCEKMTLMQIAARRCIPNQYASRLIDNSFRL